MGRGRGTLMRYGRHALRSRCLAYPVPLLAQTVALAPVWCGTIAASSCANSLPASYSCAARLAVDLPPVAGLADDHLAAAARAEVEA